MEEKKFENPELEVIYFDAEDIILTSDGKWGNSDFPELD